MVQLNRDCRYCKQPLVFDDSIRSASGSRRPLNLDKTPHTCDGAEWAFQHIRQERAELEAVPGQLNDERIVLDTMAKIMEANRQLQTCQLRLVREEA